MIETLLFALVLNMVMFLVAFRFKTDKLTDISYAVTFAGIALYGALRNDMSAVQWLVFALVCVWAVRLGSYLLIRIHAMGRDKRFDEMRNSFWKFGRFWFLQGLTAWVVMLPATFLFQTGSVTEFTTVVIVGAVIAIAGLLIESFADQQKFKFIQDKSNKGKWIESGLWKYSRHPNYLGEMLMWYGVYIISYSWLSDSEMYVALIGPLFISFMLVGVSGIPLLEKSADKRWGADKKYQAYKKRTSVLLLLPNKTK
jgi:steroid 5-alpha reductase family enzyme